MKIKLTESQIINILKESDSEGVKKIADKIGDSNQFTDAMDALSFFMSKADDVNRSDAAMIAKIAGIDMNPKFDVSSAAPEDFKTIDIWPVNDATLTSGFGPRNIGKGASKNHMGVDLGVPVGTPIFSPADGVVEAARDTTPNACGGFVKIKHDTYSTKYCHLSNFNIVKEGDQVKKGQLIGYTGGAEGARYSGNSQGPHLHYEVLVGDRHVNPTQVHTRLS